MNEITKIVKKYRTELERIGYLHIGTHIMSIKASEEVKQELKQANVEFFVKSNSYGVQVIRLAPVVEKVISKRSKDLIDKVDTSKRDLINGKAVYFGKCIRSNEVAQTIIYDFKCAGISYSIKTNSHGIVYIKLV